MKGEDVEQALDVIERNSQIQVKLIDDLLEVSRIIAGKMRLTVHEVDLREVVLSALATIEPAVAAKNITVMSILDPESPTVMGDAARLQQIVWNLLSNAVKFTPKGGRIELRMQRVASHVEVTVSDSGEGIKPELLPHVFERFWQADGTASRKHGGLGLGLSIVRQLAEMHGGTVRAHSDGPGTGATFVVSLPVAVFRQPKDDRSKSVADLVSPADNFPPWLGGVRVLVVDDEADARALVRRTLELGRAEVAAAGSVDEALALFDSFRPHVVVSDIGMPGRDGFAFIHAIRSRGAPARDVPAVALTAFAHASDRRRILLSGFQLHIAKPAEPYELIAAVAGLAGKSGTAERV
jgi:CheY-like chemotaxis protein